MSLGPFDYTGPARVRDLWICEGLTEYYTNIGLWRAGLLSDREFVESYRRSLASFEGSPNRTQHVISPEEASWTVWDSGGSISYYLQGEVLGLALDLAIRDGTDNRKSLDDVMRHMYRPLRWRARLRVPDWIEVIRAETGLDLAGFFARHVSAAEPVPWNDYLAAAGWRLQIEVTPVAALARSLGGSRRREGQAWLETVEGRVVLHVPPGSAAAVAGFEDGDRLSSSRVARSPPAPGCARPSAGSRPAISSGPRWSAWASGSSWRPRPSRATRAPSSGSRSRVARWS